MLAFRLIASRVELEVTAGLGSAFGCTTPGFRLTIIPLLVILTLICLLVKVDEGSVYII